MQRLLLGLVVLTLLALYANSYWMVRTVRLDQASAKDIIVIDDHEQGGSSVARLERDASGTHLLCQIGLDYQWPFCELALRLDEHGLDLSRFDTLRLAIRSSGPEAAQPVRVFLRNFDPAYSREGQGDTLKPHEVVYDPQREPGTVSFKLSQFAVASWWTQAHPMGADKLGPQLDRVTSLSLATGGAVQAGPHRISLVSAELSGPVIASAIFRLAIIFLWIAVILLFLAWEWRQADRHRQALHAANEALESRVEERTRALAASNARLIDTLHNLDAMRQELVEGEKNAALGMLVSGMAHELNTPIGNALLVGTTLHDIAGDLAKATAGGLTRRALDMAVADLGNGVDILTRNLTRASTLINSFKQLSNDQQSGQRRQFTLQSMLEETVHAMAPRMRPSGHTLTLAIDPDIVMQSYPGALSQIVINLINNCLAHAFEGIAHGQMQLAAQQDRAGMVELRFSDNGGGIPPAVLRRVFEPFFTTKLGRGGSGLGMHIVYNIVTQVLGGKIEIESLPGQGTLVRLRLPLQAPEAAEHAVRVGVPQDVLGDYALFLGQRAITDIARFDGPHSRRDVVEVALFMQTMQTQLASVQVDLVAVDSYADGIGKLCAGTLDLLATSAWQADLAPHQGSIMMSEAIIDAGQSVVGFYTHPGNARALACTSLAQLRALRFASNRDWSADWTTLQELGVADCHDVKTWGQMVYLVHSGQVDVVLAPFANTAGQVLRYDGCELVPVPGLSVSLAGSRHFAASLHTQGRQVAEVLFPALARLRADQTVARALADCGFLRR
ncbi:MAG: ATP-binding protein [Pseudomonadota bacterium]